MRNYTIFSRFIFLSMSSAKSTQDAKKDVFRKYLVEKAGVLELLTKSLVQPYEEPEKPNDALTYLKKTVGGSEDDKTVIERQKLIKDSDDKEYTIEITMNSDTEVSKIVYNILVDDTFQSLENHEGIFQSDQDDTDEEGMKKLNQKMLPILTCQFHSLNLQLPQNVMICLTWMQQS